MESAKSKENRHDDGEIRPRRVLCQIRKHNWLIDGGASQPSEDVANVVEQSSHADTLDGRQTGKDTNIWLHKVNTKSKRKIANHENPEEVAFEMGTAGKAENDEPKENDKYNFVELGGMALHGITEINSPRKAGGDASSVILDARKKTTDAPDGNAYAERQSEKIAGAASDAEAFFSPLDRDGATD